MSFLQAKPLATHDVYGPIHKGLRYALSHLLMRMGAVDPMNAEAVARLMADLRIQLDFSDHHMENEERFVHAALESRAPGASARLVQSHDHHRLAFEELEVLMAQLERARAAERPKLLKRLYLRFSTFVAEDFAHMAEEEQVILPVLQSLFSDAELQAIEDRIISGVSPEDLVACARMVMPAFTQQERVDLLMMVRANAPVEAYEAVLDLAVRPSLSDEDWSHLLRTLTLVV